MFKRVNSDVVPFSINSPAGNRYAFGTTDVSNDIDVNYNENIKKGFGTGPNEFPELEDFNALMFTGSYLAAYLYQAGIPEWNNKQKYYVNSITKGSDGNLYKSLTGTEETPNTNNNPILAGSTSWKSIFNEYAKINGDETKKFKVATPEGDYDAVNKKYVDENVNLNINSFPEKITPENTDNLALQETGGLLKKLSFANLKLWILSLFNPSITGTVSFNSTTNNIQLTNIVASLGLEIGDVIQISGADDAKNNSEFTVEVITDNNNIIVNQAHANKGTSKNVANRVGDTGVSIKLLCKWYNAHLGLGQGLVDVTSNRTTGANYPTQPNRAIKVMIRTTSTTTAKFIALDLNGERVNAVENYGSGGPWALALSETIPSGSTYRLNVINDLGKWMEYR